MTAVSHPRSGRFAHAQNVGLWTAQGLVALSLTGGGIWKVAVAPARLAETFAWMGDVSPALLRTTAAFDVLGGLGIALPSLTRVKPGVTVLAALGTAVMQSGAIAFHVSRGEADDTPFNVLLVALALAVAWGRSRQVPIPPRA